MKITRIIFQILFVLNTIAISATENPQQVCKSDIKGILSKVSNWQIKNFTYNQNRNLHDSGIGAWTNATLYMGMLEWAKIADDNSVSNWLNEIGIKSKWQLSANFREYPKYQLYHADEFCMAQFYLGMYDLNKDKKIIADTRERVNWVMQNPPDENMNERNKQSWTWSDALFMAPPIYAHLAILENDSSYLVFMDKHYKNAYTHLFDIDQSLFYRDARYFDMREKNGEKVFWGRGNGWVIAGLANILKYIPKESDYRSFYEELLIKMSKRLTELQGQDGFWHASLLDAESYPSPETSATALITYALAYGINNKILDEKEYLPAVQKGWEALASVVDEDGKLGFVQPIGADPKKVTREMSAVYGVGAFLLAGVEIYKLDRF